MAEDQTEWIKLPPDEKCVHKQWKARVAGYEEALKLFLSLDEKSPEFTKYLGVLKKICVDTNAIAQEKALDTVLAFVENAHVAGRSCGEVMTALVTKCLNASRAKTKEKAKEIILMYIEIDKQETVQEELMKGFENKQPKVVSGCVQTLRAALESFGPKVITLKPLVKMLPKLLEDRDKTVREETKMMVVEIYRWIGAALKPQLANLKPVQLTELETEFENLSSDRPVQTRFMRSQQDLKAKAEAAAAVADEGGREADDDEPVVEIDPMDLLDPVEILSKLPKNFYEQIEAKKWQERKEMLEAVETLATQNPKLMPGEYGDLVRALKKVLSKDTNVMLVALAAKCLTGLANGLKKKYSPYAVQCTEAILMKFKEKKPMVVTALRDCIDAIFPSTTLDAISEDLLTALADKNPNVKAETAAFIARCFTKATPTTLNKKVLKPFLEPLSKTINDTSPEVREASFDALGTAMKVVGEKVMTALLGDVDPLKMTKIKECCEKAELVNIKGKAAAPKVAAAPKAVTKPPAKSAASTKPPSSKPGTAKPAAAKAGAAKAGAGKKKPGKKAAVGESKPVEPLLADETVDEKAVEFMGEENMKNLANSNWKQRLAAMENIEQEIKRTPKEDMPTQAIVRIIGAKKPGIKDNNFQVLKLRLSALAYLAENFSFSWTSAECILPDLVEKIGDVKNGQGCKDVLTAAAEATEFPKVAGEVIRIAFEGKNPKNQSESLNWLSQAIYDFGFKVNIKALVGSLKKALAATNPAVRQAAITVLGVCYMYMGSTLRVLFEDEKPALLAQIDAEFEKVKGEKPPAPTRGLKGAEDADAGEDEAEGEDTPPVEDLVPRNDISDKMTDELLGKLSDKNWKVRKEGLDEVVAILGEAKFVTANLGGLPEALKLRLGDSNKILVTTTLGIMKTLGTASGPHCKKHVAILAAPLVSTMGDSKPMVRHAASTTLDVWVEQAKLAPFVEDGVFGESLKIENPNLRATLLNWLSPKLKEHQKKLPAELKECLPPLLTCLNDRNPDVRKAAQDAILPFMMQTGFDSMLKAASKFDKSSKDTVVGLLEKARGELPAKPKKVQSVPVVQSHVSIKEIDDLLNDKDTETEPSATKSSSAKPAKAGGAAKKAGTVRGKVAPASSRKKEVEVDTTPIITNTYTKAQRLKEEKNLKVLKWNFTVPRLEFVDQLRDQMEKNFSSSIMELLMHKDFQKHIKAIQMLTTALESYKAETLANVDLILKWFTLRFFETNPSMLNKALEYLLALFELMHRENQILTNSEADAFIPYIILKVGESKENVRREVRKIFQSLSCVYPVSKIFMFIMGGLASKNSKQRAECLEELGCMMEKHGLSICQPSTKEAIKEIAKHIADRDNPVRSAALNTIVVAHQIVGDQVYKYVGRLNDKELGMLEERIKRASRSKPAPVINPEPAAPAPKAVGRSRPSTAPTQQGHRSSSNPPTNRPSTAGTVAQGADMAAPRDPRYTLTTCYNPPMDEVVLEEISDELFRYVTEPIPPLVLKTRKLPPSTPTKGSMQQQNLLEQSPDAKSAVDMTVTNIASGDLFTASSALSQLNYTMSEPQHQNMVRSYADQIIVMITLQLKKLHTTHLNDTDSAATSAAIKLHFMCTSLIVELAEKDMIDKTSIEVFKDFIAQAVSGVLDPKLNDHPEGADCISNLNISLGKILLHGHHTNTLCAPLSLLHDCSGAVLQCTDSYIELVQKCVWKKTRNLSAVISKIEMGPVLKICNSFFNDYPPAYWRSKPSDKPLRTVKTVIATLISLASERVYTAISVATYSPKAELEAYIMKHIAKREKSSQSTVTGNETTLSQQSPGKMAQFIHNSLAGIFKKIGSRENSKEGIMDLYLFREKYPDASLEPFLKKSSSFFQMYIQRGLQNIENEKKKASSTIGLETTRGSGGESQARGEIDWMEKLRGHRERMKKLGISVKPISSSTGNLAQAVSKPPPDVVLSTRPSNVMEDVLPRPTASVAPTPVSSSVKNAELMELKARLERIKKSSQT
ncbi:cytoskeleton-associated protein 5-like isoform X2 [Watersipora subatra]|uniref:cytoskeleton-associated protein 5-like isoform X2 n=1 Tax=Watersipora subatra TaxID=2589382 RepID=UPI00355C61DE